MKNIDVMSIQQHREIANKLQKPTPTDYRRKNAKGLTSRFLFECARKLSMKPLTSATAAIIFHKFYKEIDSTNYDEFLAGRPIYRRTSLIASASLYLAGKIKDDLVKIRDVINVAHNTLNRGSNPLELGDEYWSMRDGIVQAELLITRMLKFDLNIVHPHKYMLYYMKSLQDWFGATIWSSLPIAKAAASYLQDFHHNPVILDYKPSHIAISCISLALQTYGIQVPLTDENDESTIWYYAFVKDLTKEKHWEILEHIMDVYNNETAINDN